MNLETAKCQHCLANVPLSSRVVDKDDQGEKVQKFIPPHYGKKKGSRVVVPECPGSNTDVGEPIFRNGKDASSQKTTAAA